jgi:hypothetical protein
MKKLYKRKYDIFKQIVINLLIVSFFLTAPDIMFYGEVVGIKRKKNNNTLVLVG